MKTRTKKVILIALAGTLFLGAISGGLVAAFSHTDVQEVKAYAITDPSEYYSGISISSSTLLNDLHNLNSSKRKSTVGYKAMLNDPEHGFYVTDPGLKKGSTITTFYSGKSNSGTSGLNREHVWPDSRGGSSVEADIHMPRPTLNAENGSRGNSFYVEGKKSPSSGWDPAMESFGLESYRGDSARIIFYCAIANTSLKLVDKENDSASNKTMGKLSDLLKWNLKYPVLERERVRNDGAESLQGNRNPFIDHPEYACKIWGNTNSTTKQICSQQQQTVYLERLEIQTKPSKTIYVAGEYFVSDGASIVAYYTDGTSKNVTNDVVWENKSLTVGTSSYSCRYTDGGVTVSANCPITVVAKEVHVTGFSLLKSSVTIYKNETTKVGVNILPSDATDKSVTWSSENPEIASVSKTEGVITGLSEGTTTITAITNDGNFGADCEVTVLKEIIDPDPPKPESKLIEMAVVKPPYKTVYDSKNETIDISGLTVEGHYSDGSAKILEEGVDYRVSKPKFDNPGTYNLKIRCLIENVDVPIITTPVELVESPIISIELEKTPAKTEYYLDEELITYGLKIKGICANGEEVDVTDLVQLESDLSTIGDTNLIVTLGNCSPVFVELTVKEGTPKTEEKAQDYAYVFVDKISIEINVEDVKTDDWTSLEFAFIKLDDATKKYFKNLNNQANNETSAGEFSDAEEVVEKYDEILLGSKYELNDFMERNPQPKDIEVDVGKIILISGIVIISIVALILIIVIPIKNHNRKKARMA